jgi:hypothetical protein
MLEESASLPSRGHGVDPQHFQAGGSGVAIVERPGVIVSAEPGRIEQFVSFWMALGSRRIAVYAVILSADKKERSTTPLASR